MTKDEFLSQLKRSKDAAYEMALVPIEVRNALIRAIGERLLVSTDRIIAANQRDLDHFTGDDSLRDRLLLTEDRIAAMAKAAEVVAELPDPLGTVLKTHTITPEAASRTALTVQKITVPLGLIGMIYESRPNVTLDAAILALKSGNGIILRGGHEAFETSQEIVSLIQDVFLNFDINIATLGIMDTDRELVPLLLRAEGIVDVIIPRGSNQLIQRVRREATVPVIETGAGVCHTYVESSANMQDAAKIVLNAKLQRTGVCNALDTIIVDKAIAAEFLPMILDDFREHNVEIHADEHAYATIEKQGYPYLMGADDEDYGREYLGYGCSVKTVEGIDEALSHIRQYSSKHTEVIVSQKEALCERFLREVDAASVISNASSRFTDGEVFGLGAEMGISTQKLHARGPFGVDKLVTEKWITRGDGHVRA